VSGPVLFLDVDGVLNGVETFKQRRPDMIEPANAKRLCKLAEWTGCEIVLSSAWRARHGDRKPQDLFEMRLAKFGVFDFVKRDDCRTPWKTTNGECRGDEIKAWLVRNPDVTTYAIVDDDSDMLPEQLPFFVQTNFMQGGLQDEHVERLAAILTATSPHSSAVPFKRKGE
jgi:hypothetical protein